MTVARAVTRVTVELDESESTGGDLLRFARLLLRLLLLWGPLLWRVRLPLEPDDLSSSLAILSRMQTSESAGGVLCRQVELGNNSLFDPADDAVPGGGISSIFENKQEIKITNRRKHAMLANSLPTPVVSLVFNSKILQDSSFPYVVRHEIHHFPYT